MLTGDADQPVVAVVIPCLNRASFLTPTIESVLKQDYPCVECLVVDGGSTDGTLDILRQYEGKIRWVSEPDGGQAHAINKGWLMTRGEILAWLNADDVWAVPDAVSRAVQYLKSHPEVDVVYGDCGAIDADGKLVGMAYLHEWDLEYAVEHSDHCIPQPAAFIRRSIIREVGLLDESLLFMDRDLWYRIGLVGTIEYLPSVLAYARRTPSYWDSRGHVAAENCVRITRKLFSSPGIPKSIVQKKRRAISNSYLRGTDYAYSKGRLWRTIFSYTAQAALTDPTNAPNACRRLSGHLLAGAEDDTRLMLITAGLQLARLPSAALRAVRRRTALPNTSRPWNLAGDRDIEWSWVASQVPSGPGEALDFGPGGSSLGLMAAQRGFKVTAVDLGQVIWHYDHARLHFIRGDILKLPLPKGHFDLVINCSTVEHVGLVGRYGVVHSHPDGDLEAMSRLRDLMKPDGIMLLTIPVGCDAVFMPLHRVYGLERLPKLLSGYVVENEQYWVKNDRNEWVLMDRQDALMKEPQERLYGLGCFVLRRAGDSEQC